MKILHALVGYLAITALPFHPFAFASPLAAIDYDGYVNTSTTQNLIDSASMKHFLDSIVGACHTVAYHGDYVNTTQNHRDSDSALMKRVPQAGDISLILPLLVPGALAVAALVVVAALGVVWVAEDNPKREAFTKGVINQSITQFPQWNWIICHSSYNTNFDGVEGTDWGHTHHELSISFGRTIGYDLFWARSGTFYRSDDGGFINWAYNGNIVGVDNGGSTVHFGSLF